VNWDSFHNAIQNQTDAIKVRRELEETAISELHVMGGQRFGIGGNEKTNTDARQMRQMNGYPLRSFLATGGAIVVPPKHSEGLLATPMNMGLTQYTQYNGVVGNYVSSFTEPLNAPLDNQSILLGRAGIAARSESASNPFKALQFMLNMHETQQSITDNERGHQNIRGYNQQGVMQDSVNAMEAPMKASAKKRQLEQEEESTKLARQNTETPKKQSVSEWMAERHSNAQIKKSRTPGYREEDVHNSILGDSSIKRRNDGIINTIQNQQVKQHQDELIASRLQGDRDALLETQEYDQLTPSEQRTYDLDREEGDSHAEIMALLRKEANLKNILGARQATMRELQQLHVHNMSLTAQDDSNINILAEEKKQIVGGELSSLRGPLVASIRNVKRAEKAGGDSLLDAASQSTTFLPTKSPFRIQQDSAKPNIFGEVLSPGGVKKGRYTLLSEAAQRENTSYPVGPDLQLSPDLSSTVASPGPFSKFVSNLRRHSSPSPLKGSVHPIMTDPPLTKVKPSHVLTAKGNKVASTIDTDEYGRIAVF
jgi:hypothetical protein